MQSYSSGTGGNLAASDVGLLSSRIVLPPGAQNTSAQGVEKLAQIVEKIDAPKIEQLVASLPSSSSGPQLGGGKKYFVEASELTADELEE